MKEVFQQNAEELWNGGLVKGIFNNLKLKNGDDVIDSTTFLSFLNEIDTNHNLFNFVK